MFDDKGAMTRTWIIFFERLALWETENEVAAAEGAGGDKKATFGLVKTLTVEQDLTNHYIARTGGTFTGWVANAKNPPTGTDAILDIEISRDEGLSWASIFEGTDAIVLPDGAADMAESPSFSLISGRNLIFPNNFLRINCTQIGSTFAGKDIEVVVSWE